ncbi:hypothetical protein [Frigoribacterium sp. CFBP 13712]|uniref:hypothetical protein n=1 Tax=Frigoribacterium sp. CFBP 13712 TaxID=2775309 RepID=UPI0017831E39|nr:hypothetical protein [Frigoribacterium sp. CFBP 13712]MBD8704553.1 hypothetical protein [Frigoribacterium sp. CFBP 13712]
MDDPEERPVSDPESGTPADGEEEEADSNDVALAIVFGSVGLTLFLTLDTPWAGLPMVVLGLFFGYRAVRRALRPSDEPGTTAPNE